MDKKIRIIFWVCTLAVIVCAVWSLVRTLRPSRGKPYERLTAQEALDYMSYESDYCILDVRDQDRYDEWHVKNAVCLPVANIVKDADRVIGNRDKMIYVYGEDEQQSCNASQKLSDMGFTSVSEIGGYEDLKTAIDEAP